MKNKYIKKAKEKLDEINQSEEERRLAEIRERTIRDEMAIRDNGYIDGKNEGILERNKEIIKQMLKYNMSIENIIKITNLSKSEIESLL